MMLVRFIVMSAGVLMGLCADAAQAPVRCYLRPFALSPSKRFLKIYQLVNPKGFIMKKSLLALGAVLLCASGAALADYANDRAEIENLSARYMVAVDAGDIETVMGTWADDGVLEWIRGVERGKEAIHKAMSNFGGAALLGTLPADATARQRTRHHILNHVIDIKGDTAKTTAYWFALTNNTPQRDVQMMYMGHYEDELVKRNGKWLFKTRKVFNESAQNRAMFYPGLGEKDPRKKK